MKPRSSLAAGVLLLVAALPAIPHGNEARYVDILGWKQPRITRVFAANETHFEGLNYRASYPGQARQLDGRNCVLGDILAFDVDDSYVFDVDETITLTLTYAAEYTAPFVVGWDRSGGTGAGLVEVSPPAPDGTKFRTVELALDRARFAGQGVQGADFAIGISKTAQGVATGSVAVCDVKVERSGTWRAPTQFGTFQLTVKDAATGALVPARVGLYDATGRAPLPSTAALKLQRYADDLRMLTVNERTFWPSANRAAFYVDSRYEAKVPVGTYELVATRGPEFRAWRGTVEIRADRATRTTISLERYVDMPKEGWYSGDAHIHVTRDEVADQNIWGFVSGEDVHVGNLLEMGNIANVYFRQPASAWGKASRFERDGHFLVSGQEAPRAAFMGHTIHLDIPKPYHLPTDEYFQYSKVFEEFQRSGGLSGFAHLGWSARGGSSARVIRGINLLAPLGLVDFIEVLQGGRLVTEGWYRLLDLGIRVNPAAGTDWPYTDFPGVVRFYANVPGPMNLDAWYGAYAQGRTFVTNGPMLSFTINGRGMGEEIRVRKGAKLDVAALARLNPDVDSLDRLELVVLGDVREARAAGGRDRVELKTSLTADHSMWVAVRALGGRQDARNTTIAHTAPIYVVVDDEPAWNAARVPALVAELRGQLQELLTEPYETPITGNEPWETRLLLPREWLLQQPLLRPAVNRADAAYVKLLENYRRFHPAAP